MWGKSVRNVFVYWGVISLALWLGWPITQSSHAQRRYRPESPEVKAVVDRAVEYLTNSNPSGERGVLAALAIADAGK